MRSTVILLSICLLLSAAGATGQVANIDSLRAALCERDSLYVVSPEDMEFVIQEADSLRFGLRIGWDDLALEDATCFALRGEDTLNVDIEAEGGFGDRVDRLLRFTTIGSGEIGADQPDPLLLGWRNEGPSTYGNMAGFINLANNGGIVGWDATGGDWQKLNTGLDVSWRQINVQDLAIADDGDMWASFTSGETPDTRPRGLYRHNGTGWAVVSADTFGTTRLVTGVAVEASNSNHIVVATRWDGFWVSTNGRDFVQWTTRLDPDLDPQPDAFTVTAVDWSGSRIMAAIRSQGLFVSVNNGVDFAQSESLLVPDDLDKISPSEIKPEVNDIFTDPADNSRVLVSLRYHGCYESNDGGENWHDLYGDLLVPVEGDNGAWVRSALSVTIDPAAPQTLVMGAEQWGLYRTSNGGLNWTLVADNVQPESVGSLRRIEMLADPFTPGRILALEDGWSLLASDDGGATWDHFGTQPTLSSALAIAVRPSGDRGNFVVGTWRGGMYEPGTAISVSGTYSTETSDFLRDLDLGLFIRFHSGTLTDNADVSDLPAEAFDLVGQTFQGWAVWRATGSDPDDMTLIGKFDRVNPEACIEGFCGDMNFQPVPQCYHSTRAACFERDEDTGKIWFFDDEVYNAFRYYYAVTTFDYANTAEVTPENMARDMIISPRWDGDAVSIFSGEPFYGSGNREPLQLDRAAAALESSEGIYVFPNPLRNDAGIPGEEGHTVIFTNLPEGSRVRVFTTAGDDVVDLGPENMSGGQIRWSTQNRAEESVVAGVYIYKVEVPGREDHWGRLMIIR